MDNGFTEHSGCPVYEGEKKIVTQWIRLGVDDENPWDSFNTRECSFVLWIANLHSLLLLAHTLRLWLRLRFSVGIKKSEANDQ